MKKIIIVLIVLLDSFSNLVAQHYADLMTNAQSRSNVNLNGKWNIIIDPYENGFYNYRFEENPNGYFKNDKPKDNTELIEYSFENHNWLYVPGDWNSQRDKLELYEGTIWYKTSFDLTKTKADNRLFLYFGAANYESYVYLNGEKLGKHTGGFTPFQFEITDKVTEKENFVVVKVDNKRYKDAVPTVNTDWWNYGGITRDVKVLEVPKTYIKDYFIQLKKNSVNEITGFVKLDGASSSEKIKIEIPEAGISTEIMTDQNGVALLNLKAKFKLWSPEDPKLYQVVISTETDKVEEAIGFRSIETEGQNILLNKKPIFLKGICIHEEVPSDARRAYSMEDARLLLTWAKEMGCNYVRLAHYPHNENMTRLADQMGLMVWSEIPVYWTIQWENQTTFENAKNQLTEMITRDKNRASIILWSMANETPVKDARTAFLKNLVDITRELDNTRLVTAALEVHNETGDTKILDDPLGQYLDVLGCNEYIGWYGDKKPADCESYTWKTIYNKPLVISELGADCLFGLHGDKSKRFNEEYQEDFYIHQINMLKKITFLRGVSPWILADFRSPRRPLPYIQDFWNRKGLISEKGEKKKAYFILKKYYQEIK
ncbi:MAG TPA: glycoside hydrolase family 2 TIM barrel-domain containing protein [Cytophagaceae bacterium]|nr:glycoside hydrolase family 2 TIM barrel-domain containing protein [Cytophagaceae bacterium]